MSLAETSRRTSRPIQQRNTLYALSCDDGRFSWTGPIASDDPGPDPNVFNPKGVVHRSEHIWLSAGNPDFLMAQGGDSNDCYGVTFMDQGGIADWLAFDTRSNSWTQLQPAPAYDWANAMSLPPEPIHRLPVMKHHSAALDPMTGRVLLLMSFDSEVIEPDADDGLPGFVFETGGDLSDWDYQVLKTTGQAPSFRDRYNVTVVGRQMILFGGTFSEHHHEDDVVFARPASASGYASGLVDAGLEVADEKRVFDQAVASGVVPDRAVVVA